MRGTFPTQVEIELADLVTLGIPHTARSFVFQLKIYDWLNRPVGSFPVAYFGEAKGTTFHVKSFSYSVQLLPKRVQVKYNRNPVKTAMEGLAIIGAELN